MLTHEQQRGLQLVVSYVCEHSPGRFGILCAARQACVYWSCDACGTRALSSCTRSKLSFEYVIQCYKVNHSAPQQYFKRLCRFEKQYGAYIDKTAVRTKRFVHDLIHYDLCNKLCNSLKCRNVSVGDIGQYQISAKIQGPLFSIINNSLNNTKIRIFIRSL